MIDVAFLIGAFVVWFIVLCCVTAVVLWAVTWAINWVRHKLWRRSLERQGARRVD